MTSKKFATVFFNRRALLAALTTLILVWVTVRVDLSAPLPALDARGSTQELSWVLAVEPSQARRAENVFTGTLDVSYRAVGYVAGLRNHIALLDKASECGESQRVRVQDANESMTHVDLIVRGMLIRTTCVQVSLPKQICNERSVRLPFGGNAPLGLECSFRVVTSTERSIVEHPFHARVRIAAGRSGEIPLSISVTQLSGGGDDAARKVVGPLMATVEAAVGAYTRSYFESRSLGASVLAFKELSHQQINFKSVAIDREDDLLVEFSLAGLVPEAIYRDLQQLKRTGGKS